MGGLPPVATGLDIETFPGLSPVSPEGIDLVKYPNFANVPFHKVGKFSYHTDISFFFIFTSGEDFSFP